MVASVATAVAIAVAGSLYIWERQWSPRFSVEVATASFPDPGSDAAILHVGLTITNQSRSTQKIRGFEVSAVGLRPATTSAPDQHGDLPSDLIQSYRKSGLNTIGAGEIDHGYVELLVPCSWKLVRVTVKVPYPPFSLNDPPAKRQVYERKTILSLGETCSHGDGATKLPAKTAVPD
jgi:hypothetical protein